MIDIYDLFKPTDTNEEIIEKIERQIKKDPTDDGLKSQYSDLLLDSIISGKDRYQDIQDLRQFENFKKYLRIQNQIETSLNQKAYIDFFLGENESAISKVKKWLQAPQDNSVFPLDCDSFTYLLVMPFKNAFPRFWSEVANSLNETNSKPGLKELAMALEAVYYANSSDTVIDALSTVLQKGDSIYLANELLGMTYYNLQMWRNAIVCWEKVVVLDKVMHIFSLCDLFFWLAWSYSKVRNHHREELCYRKVLKYDSEYPFSLNNLGYSLFKQNKYDEAETIFDRCLSEDKDVSYAANNKLRVLLATRQYSEAQKFINQYKKSKLSRDLIKRAERLQNKEEVIKEPVDSEYLSETDEKEEIEPACGVKLGIVKQQFASEKALEDELVNRLERDHNAFGKALSIYEAPNAYGRQFIIPIGRLDILATDNRGNLYAIELKRDSGYDDPFEQTVRYVNWLGKNMVKKGQKVYGIICLNNPSQTLIEKVRTDDRIELFEYGISYSKID